ncbi:site-2 protease family protein [Rubrobacter indicoceani]|uniref:site-2 protease family protein n=1 Tax=Rubrobacter indicoceani TaxID=2051957 RepID=UPI000E5C18A2|nr:site-2 protease family protein [Rubrobacter indicoceani]
MGSAFKVGRAFGIDVKVHWTFFLLVLFFGFFSYTQSQSITAALITGLLILALFFCVLLHEYGHSITAQKLGIEIQDITLLPIGGVARMKSMPEKPWDEVKIALAGPAVNVVLAPIFFGLALLFGGFSGGIPNLFTGVTGIGGFFGYLAIINVVLAVFNMIPAFPMDGGRVLRGLLATRLGPVRATDLSSTIGQIAAVGFFLFGLFTNPLLALVAVFIFFGASGEAQMVRQREMLRGLSVRDVMGTKRRTETVTPWHNFGQVFDAVLHGYQDDFPVVDDDGRLVGMITRTEISAAAHSPDRFSTVRDLMKTDVPTISPNADLFADAQKILQENNLRAIPVVENGELAGMLTIDDIGQASLIRDIRRVGNEPQARRP